MFNVICVLTINLLLKCIKIKVVSSFVTNFLVAPPGCTDIVIEHGCLLDYVHKVGRIPLMMMTTILTHRGSLGQSQTNIF